MGQNYYKKYKLPSFLPKINAAFCTKAIFCAKINAMQLLLRYFVIVDDKLICRWLPSQYIVVAQILERVG